MYCNIIQLTVHSKQGKRKGLGENVISAPILSDWFRGTHLRMGFLRLHSAGKREIKACIKTFSDESGINLHSKSPPLPPCCSTPTFFAIKTFVTPPSFSHISSSVVHNSITPLACLRCGPERGVETGCMVIGRKKPFRFLVRGDRWEEDGE